MVKLFLIILTSFGSFTCLSADPGVMIEVKVIFPDCPNGPGHAGDVGMHL